MIQLRLGSFSFLSVFSICFILCDAIFSSPCQIFCKWCWQLFSKVFTWSQNGSTHCTSVQRRPRIQFWHSPVFLSSRGLQSRNDHCKIHHETSTGRLCAEHGSVFGRLVSPSVALLLNSFRVPKTGWARTIHENSPHKIPQIENKSTQVANLRPSPLPHLSD